MLPPEDPILTTENTENTENTEEERKERIGRSIAFLSFSPSPCLSVSLCVLCVSVVQFRCPLGSDQGAERGAGGGRGGAFGDHDQVAGGGAGVEVIGDGVRPVGDGGVAQ